MTADEELLDRYADLVVRHNRIFSLTGAKDKSDFLKNHIQDALCAADAIGKLIPEDCSEIADLGSGCGVPGIPLAIALMKTHSMILVDRSAKRADFLSFCIASLGIGDMVRVLMADMRELKGRFRFAISRAIGRFEDVEKSLYGCMADDGILIMFKGRRDVAERTGCRYFELQDVVTLESDAKQRCLLVLHKPKNDATGLL